MIQSTDKAALSNNQRPEKAPFGVFFDAVRCGKPSPEAMKALYLAFEAQRQEINQMDIVQAAEWLTMACDEEPFHSCMAHQAQFLKEKLKK